MILMTDREKSLNISNIIESINPHLPKHHAVYAEILSISLREDQWLRAKALFDKIRSTITLALPNPPSRMDYLLAEVAEKACKVLYNGASGQSKYDSNSYHILLGRLTELICLFDAAVQALVMKSLAGILPVSDR